MPGNLLFLNRAMKFSGFKIAISLGVVTAGSLAVGGIWSAFRLDNEIKWVNKNKAYACQLLSVRQEALHGYQKNVLKDTFNNSNTTGINQAFLGTVMTTLAVERQTVNDAQLKYGCALSVFRSYIE